MVKHGFSWPAFAFNFYWSIAKRLWWLAGIIAVCVLILLVGFSVLVGIDHRFGYIGYPVVIGQITAVIFMGRRGNAWIRDQLEQQGFIHVASVEARGLREARHKAGAAVSLHQ